MNTYEITITSRFRGETMVSRFSTEAADMAHAMIDSAFCARRVASSVDEVISVEVVLVENLIICAIALVA